MIIELEELVKNGEIEIKTGPFGTQLKAAEYVESGTPVLNVKNLGYSTVVTTKVDYVGEKTLERLSMHILKEGDIVFGRKGAVDRHAYIGANEAGWMQGSDCQAAYWSRSSRCRSSGIPIPAAGRSSRNAPTACGPCRPRPARRRDCPRYSE